jgi:hypothetical protein
MLLLVGRVLLLLLPALLACGAPPALAVTFNGFWQHRATGGDDIDTRHFFQQRYGLGAGTGLSFQPTHAISAGANLSYTRTERDLGQGRATSEEITPSAHLGIANDIFQTRLFATVTESRRAPGTDQTQQSWDASLASNWTWFLWPSLRLNYGEGATTAKAGRAESGIDTRNSNYGFGLDWDLLLAKAFYAFSHTRGEDRLSEAISETESHFGRLETGGNLWQNRINVRLSQQFQQATSEFSVSVEEGEVFDLRLGGEPRAAVLAVDQVPLVAPEDVEPVSNPELGDTFLDVTALTIGFNERAHLGISFDFTQGVDVLHVYLHPFDTNHQLINSQADLLQWDLYVRPPAGVDEWVQAAEEIPATYNITESRFELNIGRQVREFKVVVTNLTGVTLSLTELEAISFLTESAASRQTSHLSNAGLRIRLTSTLTAASNLTFEKSDTEVGETERESTRRSLSSSLRWTPSPFVTPSLGFSETRQEQTGAAEAVSRSYSLIVATFPLPTLNVTVGANRSDRFSNGRRTSTSDNFSLTSTAMLYPDLTAGLSANYSMSSRERADGTITDTDSFSSRLTFNARLNRALTADLTGSYQQSETAASTTSSSDSILSLAYRPSDLLSMRLSGSRRWSGPDIPDTLAYTMNMALLRTHKTRVTFRYNHTRAVQTLNSFGLDGSWDISRSLALQSRFNYASATTDTWSILTSLALRL